MKRNLNHPATLCLAAALLLGVCTTPALAATPESAAPAEPDTVDGITLDSDTPHSLASRLFSLFSIEPAADPAPAVGVLGGEEGTSYTRQDGVLTVKSGDLTLAMEAGKPAAAQRIRVESSYTGTLILQNLNLDVTGGGCAFALEPGAKVTVKLMGINTFKSGPDEAGLRVPAQASLTLDGEGSLTAQGGENGAGIGAGRDGDAGRVEITGGTVTARGGRNGAGIGGLGAREGELVLRGGTLFAQGGSRDRDVTSVLTTPDGTGVLYADSIRHQENQADWSCLVLGDGTARWYGENNRIRSNLPLTLEGGRQLTVPAGGSLTVNKGLTLKDGTLTVRGSVTADRFTAEGGTLQVEAGGDLLVLDRFALQGGASARNSGTMTLLGIGTNEGQFRNEGSLNVTRFQHKGGTFENTETGVVEVDGEEFAEKQTNLVNHGRFVSANGGLIAASHAGLYECRIFFDGNGGTPDAEDMLTTNKMLSALPGASRPGYLFDGWYTQARGGSKVTGQEFYLVGTTVFAHWTADPTAAAAQPQPEAPADPKTPANPATPAADPSPTQHTLRFEPNGGFPVDPVSIGRGAIVELWPYNPTRTGYLFAGWYADEALTQPVSSVLMNGDKTVYAAWKADPAAKPAQTGGKAAAGGKSGSTGKSGGAGKNGKGGTATPAPSATAAPTPAPATTPAPTAEPSATPAPTAEAALPAAHNSLPLWPFLAGGAAMVAAVVVLVLLRRRGD